jgi:alpha-tubulin suppressor-like RCC1 family protein
MRPYTRERYEESLKSAIGHPFGLFLINRLCSILVCRGQIKEAMYLSVGFYRLWRLFFVKCTAPQRVHLFGRTQPLPLLLVAEYASLVLKSSEEQKHFKCTPYSTVKTFLQKTSTLESKETIPIEGWYRSIALWERVCDLAFAPYVNSNLGSRLYQLLTEAKDEPLCNFSLLTSEFTFSFPSPNARNHTDTHSLDTTLYHHPPMNVLQLWPQLERNKRVRMRSGDNNQSSMRTITDIHLGNGYTRNHINSIIPLLWIIPKVSDPMRKPLEIRLYTYITTPQTGFINNEYTANPPLLSFTIVSMTATKRWPPRSGVSMVELPMGMNDGVYVFRMYDSDSFLCQSNVFSIFKDESEISSITNVYYSHKGKISVIPFLRNIKVYSIAIGNLHRRYFAFAATERGVYAWGENNYGQLGLGSNETISKTVHSPTLIPTLADQSVVKVEISPCIRNSTIHCVALTSRGNVFSWGNGRDFQLGHGDIRDHDTPRIIQSMEGMEVIDVTLGELFSVALTKAGEIWYWGSCSSPSCLVDEEDRSQVTLRQPTRGGGLKLVNVKISKARAGPYELMLITDIGHVWHAGHIAGSYAYGVFSNYSLVNCLTPYFAVDAAIGDGVRLVLMSNGRVFGYGNGETGSLGNGHVEEVWSIVASDQSSQQEIASPSILLPPLRSIRVAGESCVGIDNNGGAWIWGAGVFLPRLYTSFSDSLHKRKVASAVPLDSDNILFYCDSNCLPRLPTPDPSRVQIHQQLMSIPLTLNIPKNVVLTNEQITVEWSRPILWCARRMYIDIVQQDKSNEKSISRVEIDMWTNKYESYESRFSLNGTVCLKMPRDPGEYKVKLIYTRDTKVNSDLISLPITVRAVKLDDLHVRLLQQEVPIRTKVNIEIDITEEMLNCWTGAQILTLWSLDSSPPEQLAAGNIKPNKNMVKIIVTKLGKIAVAIGSDPSPDFSDERYHFTCVTLSKVKPKVPDVPIPSTNLSIPEDQKELYFSLLRTLCGNDTPNSDQIKIRIEPSASFPLSPITISWELPPNGSAFYQDQIHLFNLASNQVDAGIVMVAAERKGEMRIFGPSNEGFYQARYIAYSPNMASWGSSLAVACSNTLSVSGPYDIEGLNAERDAIVEAMKVRGALVSQVAMRMYNSNMQGSSVSSGVKITGNVQVGSNVKIGSGVLIDGQLQQPTPASSSTAPSDVVDVNLSQMTPIVSSTPSITSITTMGSSTPWNVTTWLTSFGFQRFAESFIDNGYDDLEVVLHLDDDDLDAIGITQMGLRKKIKLQVAKLS